MALADKDQWQKNAKGYSGTNAKITLPWFSKYDEERIRESTIVAIKIVQQLGLEGEVDYSSGVIELCSKYELTELESEELLRTMRDKLWNSLCSGSGEVNSSVASVEGVAGENDDIVYTERTVQIKKRVYKLGPILGKGGFGVVRLGGHPDKPNKRYALKFISKKHMKNNQHFVKREISCMKQVLHKNVLRLFRYGTVEYPHEDGTFDTSMLLVTEYCPNGELFDVIFYCSKGMSQTLTRTYFHQLMEGIKAIHDCNVFHRDIKPQNVLLDSNFQLKICDFGLSNVINFIDGEDPKTLMKTKVGTRGFMAPEMMMRYEYNTAVDIFSAGVVLFNMLTGVCPFRNADPNTDKHYYRLATKDPKFWAHHTDLSKNQGVTDLIEGMLAYQPADRFKQDDIEKNEWYCGELHDESSLQQEMVNLHKVCLEKKEGDAHNHDLNSFVTRAFAKIPIIAPNHHDEYLTNFHTYKINKDQDKDCLKLLHFLLLESTSKTSDVIVASGNDVFTAKYVKTVQIKKEGEEEVKTEKHEVVLQVRAFKLEQNGNTLLTIFRTGADRDFGKECLAHLDPIYAHCDQFTFEVAGDLEFDSDDDFEDDSGFDEEEATQFAVELAAQRNEAAGEENLGEN